MPLTFSALTQAERNASPVKTNVSATEMNTRKMPVEDIPFIIIAGRIPATAAIDSDADSARYSARNTVLRLMGCVRRNSMNSSES